MNTFSTIKAYNQLYFRNHFSRTLPMAK
uniref:Uncharacterized protein n=1 Tax=Arundo donax TaxID=35708 RepID=A0A0A8Y471_ARUDO